MRCQFCGWAQSKVLDTRPTEGGVAVRRRRECPRCARRFTTFERVEDSPLLVVKKDGRREPFERGKILAGIMKACEKRPIPVAVLEELVDRIEAELRRSGEGETSAAAIGERVMAALRDLDPVAYVRFASVYREFKDLETFHQELEALRRREPEPKCSGGRNGWPRSSGN
ncbi:MAG: transcriptional regulator NrdR [Bacteroidota bacterium]